jgi:hypothetical protein
MRHVVWQKFTDVLEALAASVVRAIIAVTQKTAILILDALRT